MDAEALILLIQKMKVGERTFALILKEKSNSFMS